MRKPVIHHVSEADIEVVATLWHDGWHEAHDHLVPADEPASRSLDHFRSRVLTTGARMRAASLDHRVVGMIDVERNEIAQLFVCRSARHRGVGSALLLDAEERLRQASFATAWLTVVVGNTAARAFYEGCGWTKTRDVARPLAGHDATPLELWRFEKVL